jgi:hypothetical protein
MLIKRIKNTDIVDRTWVNQVVAPSASYDIQEAEHDQFAYDATLLADIASGIAIVNNGIVDITDVDSAIYYLQDGPLDALVKIGTGRTVFYDSAHFPTIQDAVDYCELLPESDVTVYGDYGGVTLKLPSGNFGSTGSNDNILIKKHVNIQGDGVNRTVIASITYRPTSATVGPRQVFITDILVQTTSAFAETAAASGVFFPDMLDTGLNIHRAYPGNFVANRINSIKHEACFLDGATAVYTYCSGVYYSNSKIASAEFHVDDSVANQPTGGSAGAMYFFNSFSNGLIDLYKDGGATTAFLGVYNSYIEYLTLNGNCDVALRGGSSLNKDNLILLNTGNTFVEHESWGTYNPTTPGNWTSSPIWIRDALDELAARPLNDAITNAKLANVATQTFKGRTTAATGDPEDLTVTQATAMLNNMVGDAGAGGTKGLAPAPSTGDAAANKFLKADGTWAVTPAGAGVPDGDKGDVTVSSGGTVWTIDNDVVTNTKLANVATSTIKGRVTAASGDPEDLTVAQVKTLLDLAGSNTGDQTNISGNAATVTTNANLTGDVTSVGNATSIAANAVTNAKAAQMATKTYKGRTTAATGDSEDVPVATLKTDLALVKADVGLGNVDNTSDAGKPVSTAQQTALDLKANLASPTFSGTVGGVTKSMVGLGSVDNTADTAKAIAGDVTGTLGASTVANDAISNAKLANMATQTFKGRTTAGTGDPEDLTLAQARALLIDANPRTILRSQASHVAGQVAGKYNLASADPTAVSGTGKLYVQSLIHIAAADYVSKNNATVKLKLKCMCLVNDVAPTGNFTFGLYPVTRPATSGGAALMIYTLGTVVSGSDGAVFTTPAADSMATASSAEFALPADGFYAIGVVTTATVATSSLVHLIADLQVVNA